MDLVIIDAATVNTLYLWRDEDYKNAERKIDLSGKLTGAATENITLTPSDLEEIFFDGVYFIEAETDTQTSVGFAWNLVRYKECVIAYIGMLDRASNCGECMVEKGDELINIHTLLTGLEYALDLRYVERILEYTRALDLLCKENCDGCGPAVTDNNSQDYNAHEIDVYVDGGSLD